MEDTVHPTQAAVEAKRGDDIAAIERVQSGTEDFEKDHPDYNRVDNEIAKYAEGAGIDISKDESKRLRRLIDRRVLVVMVLTYFLQALDKGTLSFTSIMGITDLPGVADNYSWLTTCIYIAILIVEYPQNWIIQRVPIAKYLSVNIMLWGAILALHAACHNFTGLVVVRTLLGIFESVCQPSFLYMSAMWYRRDEQAETVTYWYMMNGAQQIVGGLLAYCFTLITHGPLLSWQAIFITYGCVSVLFGVFVLWWLPDSPMRAKCFSETDKTLMVERVRSNQTGLQNKKFRAYQVWDALTDVQTWCYCMIQICTTLPTSGLGAFANLIITGFGFSILQTQLLAMVLGAFIILILLSSTWLVKKTHQNLLVMGVYVLPSIVGTIVLMTVVNTNTATEAGLLFSYYICLSFWAAQTLGMSMLTRNVGGETKKSVARAMNFIAWAAGNAAGPQVFLAWDAPRYFIAFSTHMGCYVLLILVIITLRWHLKRQNRLKDERTGGAIDDRYVHAFEDLTDRENLNFRPKIRYGDDSFSRLRDV